MQQDKFNVRLLKRTEVVGQYRHHMDYKYQKENASVNKSCGNKKLVIKNVADTGLTKKEKRSKKRMV